MHFNPHSREGSDRGIAGKFRPYIYFNPHSREGSDIRGGISSSPSANFNPHSREGSDACVMLCAARNSPISIHTPAKGVTRVCIRAVDLLFDISIHTPAKGVTRTGDVRSTSGQIEISIHTPAKGVTAILPNFRLYIL